MKTRFSRQIKKVLSVILAACIMVSAFSITTYSKAASKKTEVYQPVGNNVKYKDYTYYISENDKSIKFVRKNKSGKKETLIKLNKQPGTKKYADFGENRFVFSSIYTDGLNLVYLESDNEEQKCTLVKKSIKGNNEKRIEIPTKGVGYPRINLVSRNTCYTSFTPVTRATGKASSYIVNMDTGKIKKNNKKSITDRGLKTRDGRYYYGAGYVFDLKKNKKLKYPKSIKSVVFGEDGNYAFTEKNDKWIIYPLNINKVVYSKKLELSPVSGTGISDDSFFVSRKYVYYVAYTGNYADDNRKWYFYKMDRKTGKTIKISKKKYQDANKAQSSYKVVKLFAEWF